MNNGLVAIASGFGLDSLLRPSAKNQETSLSPGLLQGCPHERVDQFVQDNLTRGRLRNLDNRSEVKMFDRCRDRSRRTGGGRLPRQKGYKFSGFRTLPSAPQRR